MNPQRIIIENIRNSYKISSGANESDRENFQGLIGKLHRSLIKLAEDLYSKETHFVLELIQNADDNDYDHPEPLLKFIIDAENILIQNNEKGFAEKHVRALCDVGQSTKSKSLGYIGEKGIGFKSVFRVTDEPHIFSNGFRFKFKRNDEENNLGYIVPHWIETAPEFIDENLTNILLPLKDDAKEHQLKFQEIEPELLLFLQKLSIIEIYSNSEESSTRYHKVTENGLVKIKAAQSESHYKLVTKLLQVPETIQEEKRDLKETKLILGFPVNENGSSLINNDQKIFAFLPTRSYGFKFIIQADFLVPTSREDIHKDKKWNKWLRDNISNVFLEAVDEFKKDEQLKTTFYNYIPVENEVKDSFFSIAVKQLHKKLVGSECVLTESGKWLKPAEVFRANEEIRSLIANDELKKFFNKEYVSSAVERNSDSKILESLGVSTFSIDNLIECLKDSEWLKNQSDEWFIELYSYLEKQSLGKQRLERIKKLKIIKLTNNELASPIEQKIFFPLSKRQSYGFEKRIPFINKKTLALNNKEESGRVEKFLQSIDVFKAQPYEIIENYILPDYENDSDDGWKSRDKELLLGYVRYIKDNLVEYEKESDKRLNSHKSQWQTKTDPLQRLKKGIWILFIKRADDTWYSKPEDLYLTKDYGNNNDLEFLFSGIENISFVHSLYIKSSIENIRQNARKAKSGKKKLKENINDEIKEWNKFFTKLGVETKPRINKIERTRWNARGYYSNKVYENSSVAISSIINQNNRDKNFKLLSILDSNWDYYKDKTKWRDCFYDRNWKYFYQDSDWIEKLIDADWLPSTNRTLQKPSNLFLDKPEIKDLLGDNVSYLAAEIENQEFIEALSINTTVDVETILEHLKRMVEDNCSDKEKFIKFYSYLNSNFVSYEQLIKKTFADNELIFIPESVEKYVSSEKSLWKDVSKVFGEQRFYLEKHYDSLKKFFVEKLGINEKPTPKDYADVLCEMTERDSIDKNDEEKILNIYKELNNSLKPDNKEATITDEEWWDDFIHKGIYWTNKSDFWTNDDDVFVNDEEELYKLFQDKSSVAFLKLPSNSHPKLQYFLKETGLTYLSKAAKTQLPSAVETISAEELTEKVRQLFPFILRYLYFNVNDIYEKSKEDERLVKLKNLFCYGVDKLEVNYSLNEESATQERSHYLDGNKLYVNLDFLDNYNRIAIELSKIFGNPQGLNDFISVLFLQRDLIAIEEYLKDRNIQELPESEKQTIEELISLPTIDDVSPEVLEENINLPEDDTKQKTVDQALDNVAEEQDKKEDADAEITADFEEECEETLENSVIQKEPNGSKKTSSARNTNENGNQTVPEYESQEECSPEEAEVRVSTPDLKDPNAFTFSTPEEEENSSSGGISGAANNGDSEPSSRESLSQAEKMDIGRWGEEYSLKRIKEKFLEKYSDGSVLETSDGFDVMVNKKAVAKVYWLNKNSDVGKGYDIKIIENGEETFIEVKSTKTESKEIFQISGTQWRLAQLQQNNFIVYRVFNARTERARLVEIRNPAELFRTGHIIAHNITLKM